MDDTSIFLARLIGAFLLITGPIIGLRRKSFIPTMNDFIKDRALRLVVPIFELVAGLAVVLKHNLWVADYRGIITVFAYLMILESLFYLLLPEKLLLKAYKAMNRDIWYRFGSVFSILLGLYLVTR